MNYYQHHIGDFNAATRHLTRLERSVYRDLIELYYEIESPLPADHAALARRILVRGDDELAAMGLVLEEFFTLDDGHYRHHRCDRELSGIYEKSEKARLSAEKRWERERKKKANATPKQCDEDANAMRTHSERNANGMLPITHNPLPNTHTPPNPPRGDADDLLEYLNLRAGKSYRLTDTNRKPIQARLAEGFTVADCRRVIDNRVERWAGTEQAQYLRPDTLFRPKNFESYLNDQGEQGNGNKSSSGRPGLSVAERVSRASEQWAEGYGDPLAAHGRDLRQ